MTPPHRNRDSRDRRNLGRRVSSPHQLNPTRIGPGDLDPWDEALLAALERDPEETLLTLPELAEASNFSTTLLEVVIREGFLTPGPRRTPSRSSSCPTPSRSKPGSPWSRPGCHSESCSTSPAGPTAAMRPIAERAVEVFARYVRDSVEANASSDEEAVQQTRLGVHDDAPGHRTSGRPPLPPPSDRRSPAAPGRRRVTIRIDPTDLTIEAALERRPHTVWISPELTLAGFGQRLRLDPGVGPGRFERAR